MTDQTEQMPEPQWTPDQLAEEAAQFGPYAAGPTPGGTGYTYALSDHKITLSFSPNREPNLTVRGNSAMEINALLEEVEAENVFGMLAQAKQAWLGSMPPAELITQQLGGQVVEQRYHQGGGQQPSAVAQQVAQAYPTPPNGFAGPPVPSPGQPPFGAPAGGYQPPQPQWGGGQPSGRPAGWYAVKIPYQQKDAGDQVKNQLKAQGMYQGNVKWEGETKTWLVSPNVVQYFAQWNPVPA